MITWIDTISVIGSVASIGAAIWAYVEAKDAKESATKAEKIKLEIIQRRKLIEASRVHTETTKALTTISKVGPSCTQSLLRGINCASLAKEIEEYTRFINEQSSHFSDFFGNSAKALCTSLHPLIEQLSEAKTFEQKKATGKSIYYLINDFLPLAKSLSDEKREDISTS